MKIIIDESVSFGVATFLRSQGNDVLSIAESSPGIKDNEVFELAKKEKAILITRDHHFTNNLRFPPDKTLCIVFIRKGNLTSKEEIDLIKQFFNSHIVSDFMGHLVTIYKDTIKVR